MTFVFKQGYPYGFPYFLPTDEPFWDFTVFTERFQHFGQPSFWQDWNYPFTYPAPVAIVFALFYKLPYPLLTYVVTFSAGLLWATWLMVRALVSRGISLPIAGSFVLSILAMCWPLHYSFHRENIEGVVALVLAAGILSAARHKWWLAATLIGLAGAMKLFPLVLLGLMLSDRRYKEFAWGVAVAILVTLGSLYWLGPNIPTAHSHITAGLLYFQQHWAAHLFVTGGIGFDHSLFELVKIPVAIVSAWRHPPTPEAGVTLVRLFGHAIDPEPHAVRIALSIYTALVALGGVALYFLRIRHLPLLNQILALTICAVLLPPVSFDYTLIHLLLPLALLCLYSVDQSRRGEQVVGLLPCLLCFAVILNVDSFVSLHWRLAGQLRAVALLLLLVLVLKHRFAPRTVEQAQDSRAIRDGTSLSTV